jgi:thiol-disulfide isomerase/thioredoxin
MRIVDRHFRLGCFFSILVVGLVGLPGLEVNAFAASPPEIPTMADAELNQIITNGSGKYVLFFTAAWCGYCKEMLPTLNRLYHRFNDRGLRFIGISIDAGGPAAMARDLEKKPVDFAVYWVGETVIDRFNLVGIPMIFLVKSGRIVEKIPGKCSYAFLEGKLRDFIQ